MTKTHYKSLEDNAYIGSYALMKGDTNIELVVTIETIKHEQVMGPDGKKEDCNIAYLKGQKPMVLNATNQKTMTKLFGSPYIEDWAGKQMTLYVANVRAFGETVPALRVRDKPPVITLEALTPQHPRWEGAKTALKAKNTTVDAIRKKYTLSPENEKLLLA